MLKYESMICQSREGVFAASFDLKEVIKETCLLKVFILINKYFPNYFFNSENSFFERKKWEEYILNDFEYKPASSIGISFQADVYVQDDDGSVFLMKGVDEVLKLIYGMSSETPVFAVLFYSYVYFDKNIITLDSPNGVRKEIVNQAVAAKKNRKILTSLLQDLEQLLGAKISYFEGGVGFSDEYVFKYGIKEDAVLDKVLEKQQ